MSIKELFKRRKKYNAPPFEEVWHPYPITEDTNFYQINNPESDSISSGNLSEEYQTIEDAAKITEEYPIDCKTSESESSLSDEVALNDKTENAINLISDCHTYVDEIKNLLDRTDVTRDEALETLKKVVGFIEQSQEQMQKYKEKELENFHKEVPDGCQVRTWFEKLGYMEDINLILEEYWLKVSPIFNQNGTWYMNIFANSDGHKDSNPDYRGKYSYKFTVNMGEGKSLAYDVRWYLRFFLKVLPYLQFHISGDEIKEKLAANGLVSFNVKDLDDYKLVDFCCKQGKLDLTCTILNVGEHYPTHWKLGFTDVAEKKIEDYIAKNVQRIIATGAKDDFMYD